MVVPTDFLPMDIRNSWDPGVLPTKNRATRGFSGGFLVCLSITK